MIATGRIATDSCPVPRRPWAAIRVATGLSLPSILALGAGSYERRGPYFSDKTQGLYVVRPHLQ